jgi:hypothetical protein
MSQRSRRWRDIEAERRRYRRLFELVRKEPEKQKEERHRGGEENTGSHLDKSMKMTIGHMGCVIIGFIIVALSYW